MAKNNPKKKSGRPTGAKSKLNLPKKNIGEAVEWARMIYEQAKNDEILADDLVNYIEVSKGFTSPALSVLDKFGFIEKGGHGWKISELGRRAIKGDKEAIIEALERIELFRDLLRTFKDTGVSRNIILKHLRKKYRFGENVETIADKYDEAMKFVDSLEERKIPQEKKVQTEISDSKIITLLKVKYAFHPLEKESKGELIEQLYKEFKDDKDTTISSLVEQINKNKNKDDVIIALIDTLLHSFEQRYSLLKSEKKKIVKHKEVEKKKEDNTQHE